MKVKNGIASSRSFDRMPKTRSGSACRKLGVEEAELDADDAEEEPDRGEREGDGIADQQEHDEARRT